MPNHNDSQDVFTGDQHNGHQKLADMRGLPVRDMEELLIVNHNSVVRKHDRVFHLGDVFYRCEPKRKRAIFEKLNGSHHLIIGNHDDSDTISGLRWAVPPQQMMLLKSGDTRLCLMHYAMRVWPGMHKGALHLYGHSHNRIPADSLSCDVGVDAWDLFPVTLPQIKARLALAPPHADAETQDGPDNDNTSGGLKP
jgi:calcineurin-like phosphoesterase family protein